MALSIIVSFSQPVFFCIFFFVPLWKKRNSGTKTHCSVFCSVVEKPEQKCKKRNSGSKTHCSVFVLLWKNGTVVQKNGTVVQKHTVPFFLFRCRNNGIVVQKTEQKCKNGTVVQKHTVPFFVRLWKNGTVVQKTEQWYKNTLFRFCSVVEKAEQKCKKRNSGTKTHCSVFCSSVEKTEQWFKKRNSGTKKTWINPPSYANSCVL